MLLLIISCGFTVIYSVRIILFIGSEEIKTLRIYLFGEVDKYIMVSIKVLGVFGIFGGCILN
jgi:hypothetical protein